ncbi:MAG TPA: hypothetical protein DCM59_09265 [Clostridium sp.]|nr:hypothetical protein [Clostridium sp.]
MKKAKLKSLCGILILVIALAFLGCNNVNDNESSKEDTTEVIDPSNQDKGESPLNSKEKTEDKIVKNPSDSTRELEFKASYERSPYYNSSKEYPIITICKSKGDLKEHEAKVKGLTVSKLCYVSENNDVNLSKYNDEFFTKKALIVITLDESSGSVRHNVKKVVKDSNEITVVIERKVPELGTADMAEWNIYIELNAEDVDKNDIVNLGFNE